MCARAAGWIAQALNTWFWENTLFWFVLESSLIHLEELKPTETSFKLRGLCPVLGFPQIPGVKLRTTKDARSQHLRNWRGKVQMQLDFLLCELPSESSLEVF